MNVFKEQSPLFAIGGRKRLRSLVAAILMGSDAQCSALAPSAFSAPVGHYPVFPIRDAVMRVKPKNWPWSARNMAASGSNPRPTVSQIWSQSSQSSQSRQLPSTMSAVSTATRPLRSQCVKIDVVEVCAVTRTHWSVQHEQPKCDEKGHAHRRVERHQYDDKVTLPDGSVVTAVSFSEIDPYNRVKWPDFGLYLDPRWAPPWPHDHLQWPDLGVPQDVGKFSLALQSLLAAARVDRRVAIGCLGGRGRTGTALACLAILSGLPQAEALEWVRTTYCSHAVETSEQAAFVAAFTG